MIAGDLVLLHLTDRVPPDVSTKDGLGLKISLWLAPTLGGVSVVKRCRVPKFVEISSTFLAKD